MNAHINKFPREVSSTSDMHNILTYTSSQAKGVCTIGFTNVTGLFIKSLAKVYMSVSLPFNVRLIQLFKGNLLTLVIKTTDVSQLYPTNIMAFCGSLLGRINEDMQNTLPQIYVVKFAEKEMESG